MDKYQLKEKYQRFKQWQEKPFDYKFNSNEVHHCNNCGNDFAGNFCPYCSQRADVGRISWLSVHQGVMDIWGLGTRSLLYTLLQLLLRPGQIISDYISGKRQVSFPPVKMLFVVALIYSAVAYWFIPDVLGYKMDIDNTSSNGLFNSFKEWSQNHYSWSSLIMSLLAIFPTWVMFRNSPLHTRHLLPEGFFIQIFLSVLSMVISFISLPLLLIDANVRLSLSVLALMIYYIIVYKHLFGYSLWGTLWRQGFVLFTVGLLEFAIMMVFGFDSSMFNWKKVSLTPMQLGMLSSAIVLALAAMTLSFGWLCNQVATWWTRRRARRLEGFQGLNY